jgi:septal ring factor EnvC (AmiA/AmiB activator)
MAATDLTAFFDVRRRTADLVGARQRRAAPLSKKGRDNAMTRTLTAVMSLVLGGLLFAGTGCEDQKCKEDLQAATSAGEKAQKDLTTKQNELNAAKGALASTQAELAKVKKELEEAKAAAAKAAEPAPAPAPAKKGKK